MAVVVPMLVALSAGRFQLRARVVKVSVSSRFATTHPLPECAVTVNCVLGWPRKSTWSRNGLRISMQSETPVPVTLADQSPPVQLCR